MGTKPEDLDAEDDAMRKLLINDVEKDDNIKQKRSSEDYEALIKEFGDKEKRGQVTAVATSLRDINSRKAAAQFRSDELP